MSEPTPVREQPSGVVTTVVERHVKPGLVFGAIAAAVIPDWPFPLRLVAVIAVEITLMTYVLLPFLTRRLARWIYPRTTTRPAVE